MRFLLVCNICKRAKPKQHWVATPPCFTPKPDVEIVKTACPKCCAKAIRLASEDVFGRLNYLQQSSAFAHFMGALISQSEHDQPPDWYTIADALRRSVEFAKNNRN